MKIMILSVLIGSVLVVPALALDEVGLLNQDIALIRYQVTAIEHQFADGQEEQKIKAFDALIAKTDELIAQFPERPESYVWKGIALSAQAKHKGKGLAALSAVRRAKKYLEKANAMDPSMSDGAAYNALAMLYSKVPSWPISFGNQRKAEEYFQKALKVSSNLDTNYRYGEFLIAKGQVEEGLKYLEKALNFPERPGRKEERLKKKEISDLIKKYKKE